MAKKHIYFFPGLGASPKIFEHISLPKESFEIHLLEWKIPLSINESIEAYAKRMCEEITHENPILLGVSFGGILVQEMSKLISVEKIILISCIKSSHEFPNRLKIIQTTKVYKLFPTKITENLEAYTKYFLGDFLKKRADLYKMYLSVRNAEYMKWAIYQVLHWHQEEAPKNIIHIHGTEDHVFPIKYINDCISIENGTHTMILLKAKKISQIIRNSLT
ncbi:MAG: alpha/beta hydrolase [Flavobacteriaceae bacterium]|nr:alpha/beta hydrolase [Flavobacteriaceae bacterium]